MPLSKERMRELSQQRRDAKRQTCDKPNANLSDKPKQEKLTELRGLMENPTQLSDVVKPKAPLYRRGFHKQGDLVRMPGYNLEVIVPELDGEFNPVPEM